MNAKTKPLDCGPHLSAVPADRAGPEELDLDPPAQEQQPSQQLSECSDGSLVDAIRQCEAIRYRALSDQLALITEAQRRGLCLTPGPRPADRPAAAGTDAEDPPT